MGDNDFPYDGVLDPNLGDQYDESVKKCKQMIISCFEAVSKTLDHHDAWALFASFTRTYRGKYCRKGKKGVHDSDFDTALLAAYDAAPRGKIKANTDKVGAMHPKSPKSPDATQKHLRRLLKARKNNQQAYEAFCEEEAIARRKERGQIAPE